MKLAYILAAAAVATHPAWAQDRSAPEPVLIHLGPVELKPSAFFDSIGMTRSLTTPDSVSTKFGKIPLDDSPGESLGTVRHSRLILTSTVPAGAMELKVYLESDFMNFTPGQSPYRWRQYWAQAKIGKWEILGGQAWSLLRPNRSGTDSDKDLMHTDVIDPAYHVGLLGTRVRQIRVARSMGIYKAAVAWEGDGNLLAKLVRDQNRNHLEAGVFGGRFGRRGATASAVLSVTPRLRLVTQQYWSKHAAYQALGILPPGVNGVSSLEGVEVQVRRSVELYSYGGLVYGARASATGNRLVSQWTAGWNQKVGLAGLRSGLLLSLQYSHLERSIWDGRDGAMDFVMYRMRYTFN